MNNYTLLPAVGVKTDFQDWNPLRNRYNSKQKTPKRPPPKKLVASVIREFEDWAKTYHVDASKYRFIKPAQFEGEWRQFDFMDSDSHKYPAKITIHSILANNNGKIFQRIIETV